MKTEINAENWTYTHYALADMKAKLCIGGELKGDEYQEIYFVSVLDAENQEISQTVHPSLDHALKMINLGHHGWDFIDETLKPTGSGCATCVAH
ncbi:MAG: hypothetical protein ACOYL6_15175 [Bacteriovoracaceae bacterium]